MRKKHSCGRRFFAGRNAGTAVVGRGRQSVCFVTPTIASEEVLIPDWKKNKYIRQFLARDQPGKLPTYGALLLVGGGDDIC